MVKKTKTLRERTDLTGMEEERILPSCIFTEKIYFTGTHILIKSLMFLILML